MAKVEDLKLKEDLPSGGAIDDSTESASSTYSSEKINDVIDNAVRGVAVFVSATEPTGMQTNDIWIKI